MIAHGSCRRCGDPLPLDGRCDCRGDPDRDRLADGLWHHKVAVIGGTAYALKSAPEVDRRSVGFRPNV